MAVSAFYDALETRGAEAREVALMAALPKLIGAARESAPAYRRLLAAVDPAAIASRAALARLPVTRKSALIELQRQNPPLGGFNAVPVAALGRLYASPGPIYELEARRPDFFRMARAMFAAGFRQGDLVHNAFSYHLTPAGAMAEGAAASLGCPVIPAGTGQTEQQVATIAHLRPSAYVGTPSFLKIILDRAGELGIDVSSLTKGLVGAEAYPGALRAEFAARGVAALQCYGTADLGLIAYETTGADGALCDGMILDEGVILELVAPGTGDPVAPGEVGEVVVTTLTPEYPLIRFATGDLSALLPEPSPCGRTNQRIRGWLGRADQTAKVRGMFVHPNQVGEIARRHPSIAKARLVIERPASADVMTLHIETAASQDEDAAIVASIQAVTKLRGGVARVPAGSLPDDGKVIEDRRPIG
ncbi:MAG TPA: AMP-binding protein [Stellaceae bacterium]|nr:AMP-binding protein [Stellaceae bacterium]